MHRRSFARVAGSVAAGAAIGVDAVAATEAVETHDPVEIESWDGTTIVGTLFIPSGDGPHQAVVATHGYGGDRTSAGTVARRYAEHGYVALAYASRGFGDSGSECRRRRPPPLRPAAPRMLNIRLYPLYHQ